MFKMTIFEKIYNKLIHFASSLGEPRIVLACFIAVMLFLIVIAFTIYRRKKILSHKQTLTLKTTPTKSAHVITSHDIRAIAGEDVISTQLDLARAYIEIGKKQLAQKILDHAIKQGNLIQRQEAHQLLKNLS